MLPPENRLRRSVDFRHVLRGGRRGVAPTMVVHAASTDSAGVDGNVVRVGLAVNRAVGGAVVRNRVKRLIREAVRHRVDELSESARGALDLVVRAKPAAAAASLDDVSRDLDACLVDLSLVRPSKRWEPSERSRRQVHDVPTRGTAAVSGQALV